MRWYGKEQTNYTRSSICYIVGRCHRDTWSKGFDHHLTPLQRHFFFKTSIKFLYNYDAILTATSMSPRCSLCNDNMADISTTVTFATTPKIVVEQPSSHLIELSCIPEKTPAKTIKWRHGLFECFTGEDTSVCMLLAAIWSRL